MNEVVFQAVLTLKPPKRGDKVRKVAEQVFFRGVIWSGFDMDNPGVLIQAYDLLVFTTVVPCKDVHGVPGASQRSGQLVNVHVHAAGIPGTQARKGATVHTKKGDAFG